MKLCSACLLGLKTRYNGEAKNKEKINKLLRNTKLIPVCPEQLGGLPTPREPAEPTKDGKKIIKDKGKVITKSGKNQTPKFIKGAKETLKIAKKLEIKELTLLVYGVKIVRCPVYLKERSAILTEEGVEKDALKNA